MQKLLSYARRACADYNMIENGDKIAVGVSGGKDSITLLHTLNELRKFYPNKYELIAITLDLGFLGTDYSTVVEYCKKHKIEYIIEKTDIAEIIFDIRKEQNPCSLCANMRRGRLYSTAKAQGCNKVAMGHHNDDAIETFFLCLFNEGRISCFSPVTYLSRVDITLIRPFIYLPELEIRRYVKQNNIIPVHNPCPANGNTHRQYIKDFIKDKEKQSKGFKKRVFSAMKGKNVGGF